MLDSKRQNQEGITTNCETHRTLLSCCFGFSISCIFFLIPPLAAFTLVEYTTGSVYVSNDRRVEKESISKQNFKHCTVQPSLNPRVHALSHTFVLAHAM